MKKFFIAALTLLLLFPQTIKAEEPVSLSPLYMYSSNYILIDQDSGEILASKNPDKHVYPASITKALTLITAIELLDKTPLSTEYTVPAEVFDGLSSIASIADFQEGDTLPLSDYLYGINLPSGADATRIISMYLTQDPEGLAEEMNKLAKKIGMKNSYFINTSGLDEEGHYSTVEDLALMIRYALNNETFKQIYTTVEHTTNPTPKYPEGIKFINSFLDTAVKEGFPELYGAKSGYTELSERSLSSVATNGTMNLIFVSTNAPRETKPMTNLIDAMNVYKYTFEDYQRVEIQKENTLLGAVDVKYRNRPLTVNATKDITKYFSSDLNLSDFDISFTQAADLEAPFEKGKRIGSIKYSKDDTILYEEDLYAREDIQKSMRYRILDFSISFLKVVLVIVFVLLVLILAIRQYNLYKIRKKRREMGWVRKEK